MTPNLFGEEAGEEERAPTTLRSTLPPDITSWLSAYELPPFRNTDVDVFHTGTILDRWTPTVCAY